tara:strand:+ start:204 stop:1034 length:831 start_codon:yes stop_codon:yes gene_type:complete
MIRLAEQQDLRLGVVNFMNTTPLIHGLELNEGIELVLKVPSELVSLVEQGEVDFALSSSIDYQQSSCDLSILPVSGLSSNGETLTVKVCSRVPLQDITKVHCDTDSHTSVVLLQIILQKQYGCSVDVVSKDLGAMKHGEYELPNVILMIGDKVVKNDVSDSHPYEVDLGEAWKQLTGLPFVFAVWLGQSDLRSHKAKQAAIAIDRQFRCNNQRIEQVVAKNADSRGWNCNLALKYLTNHMDYSWTREHKQSLELFYKYANELGLIEQNKPLTFFRY